MHSESRLVYTYDTLGRVIEKKYATTDKATTYGYLNVSGNKTTSLVSYVDNFGNKLTYTYDNLGNIKTVSENGTLQETYTYDALSRLTRVDSAVQNKTVVYTYDAGGNILSKTEYPYTTGTLGTAVKTINYGYTDPVWKDLMTSYDGQTITYDTIGNPLQYRDGMTFTWQGRELLSVTKNGKTVNYTYDSNGQRISKTVDGETTDYYVVDGVRIGEHKAGRDILYMHDEKGDIYGLCYDGITHYFVQNVQGDIIGILNKTGTLVAKYEYDAWGNVTAIPVAEDGCGHSVDSPDHIAHVNPFRYRGYYYDAETGFYWLKSRYYDPEVGRFISADGYAYTGQDMNGSNMYAYCGNNPINRSDPSGMFWKEVGNWFSNKWNNVKTWAKNTFGAGTLASHTTKRTEKVYLPDPLPVTAKTGEKTSFTLSTNGNSSKPVFAYWQCGTNKDGNLVSGGIKATVSNFTLNASLGINSWGLHNIEITGSIFDGTNTTQSITLRVTPLLGRAEIEGSSTVKWDKFSEETVYTNIGINGSTIAALYVFATTGQYVPVPSPSPSY